MPSRSPPKPRADSFIAKLKSLDEPFLQMLEQIRITSIDTKQSTSKSGSRTILEVRKQVSEMCKKHESIPKPSLMTKEVEWPKSQIECYNSYKEKSNSIGSAREGGRAAAKEAHQCREKGESMAVQEMKLHHAIKQLHRWADAAIATGVARLEFMVKYCPGAFKAEGANTGHLIAAESALLCAKNAVRKLEHEKRNLEALKKRQENILRAQLRPVQSCQAKRPRTRDVKAPVISA